MSQYEFTWEEIKKHNTIESCWVVANEIVYDVTPFILNHPAGKDIILLSAGMDCSEAISFHSRRAVVLWNSMIIGKIKKDSFFSCTKGLFYSS